MIKDGKYRYTLQFGMDREEECVAGNFLERLGNRKSQVIIAALNEYLQNHPDLSDGKAAVQVQISGIDPRGLEAKIRQLIEERIGVGLPVATQRNDDSPSETGDISEDILDMLSDLDCFE